MLRRFWSVCAACVVVVAGCSSVEESVSFIRPPLPEDEQSASVGSSEGESTQSDGDVLMSGRYRVGADGKLLRPQDAPIPDEPVYPEEANFETPEGAEAFIRYVIDSYEYMIVSGDTEAFEKLGLPECGWCDGHLQKRKQTDEDGGWVETIDLEVTSIQFPYEIEGHPGLWNSDFTLRTNKLIGYSRGKHVDKEPYDVKMRAQMRFNGGRWMLHDLGKVE